MATATHLAGNIQAAPAVQVAWAVNTVRAELKLSTDGDTRMRQGILPRGIAVGLVACCMIALGLVACQRGAVGQAPPAPEPAKEATLSVEGRSPKAAFEEYYEPVDGSVEASVAQYALPLDLNGVCNIDQFPAYWLRDGVDDAVRRNGFAVADYGRDEDILSVYKRANGADVPVFITADTLLHLYHLQFDQTLKGIEEREFYGAIVEFSEVMLAHSMTQFESFQGELKEAARRNVAYFSVGLACLGREAQPPGPVRDEVAREVKLIEAHGGFSGSPIFKYDEDYSQYLPRGHYTRSITLKRYFKALMWYGRISMLLKGESGGGLIADEDAKIQTLQACLIAQQLYREHGAKLLDIWDRIYSVTAFYVGLADDLTPFEYAEAIREVAGAAVDWSSLSGEAGLHELKSELATYRAPKIYGGTGDVVLMPPFSPEQLDDLLDATKGLRLMGQRFVPDAHMMQNLIFPRPGAFTGSGRPFTLGMTPGGPQRVFARGLDVLAVLGSQRAYDILNAEGDTAYAEYDKRLAELREEFGKQTPAQWNRNLYGSWLYSLQALLEPCGAGHPTCMQGEAYRDRMLWAALASWAQLRHDTILYAKQPYAARAGSAAPGEEPPPPPPGYVEPLPEFYARMLTLARMTRAGLDDMGVLDETALQRLTRLEEIIDNLLRISRIELRGEPISAEDADYIKWIGSRMKGCIEGIEDEEEKTTIVADVQTDANSGRCLEEGVGYVKLLIAAYKLPDGRVALGVGPVMSYYEFKHPMKDRLTDEKWRELLRADAPDAPGWTRSFYVAQ